jgi:hypothetical protein
MLLRCRSKSPCPGARAGVWRFTWLLRRVPQILPKSTVHARNDTASLTRPFPYALLAISVAMPAVLLLWSPLVLAKVDRATARCCPILDRSHAPYLPPGAQYYRCEVGALIVIRV